MRALLVGALAAAAALTAPVSASAELTGPQQIALLNTQRAANGLPADVVEIPDWSLGCKKHMEWVALNGLAHIEPKDSPGYSVEGAAAGESSVLISAGDAFSPDGVNAFENAPIHLSQMLSPYLTESGAHRGCLTTLRDDDRVFPAPATFSYPGDGRTNVPTSEVSSEGPFVPAAAVGLARPGDPTRSLLTGPSLYFYYATARKPGRFFGTGTITTATLTGPDGAVEVRKVDNSTPAPPGTPVPPGAVEATPLGRYLPPGGILIPVAPLKPNATYTASVTFQPELKFGIQEPAISRTWKFSTGSAGSSTPPPPAEPDGGVYVTVPAGQTTVTGATTPSTSTPLQPMDPTVAAGLTLVPKPTKVRLRARELSFVAPLSAKVRVTVSRDHKLKGGRTKTEQVLRKTLTITQGKTVKLRTDKKVPKGTWTVRLATPGSGFASDVSVRRS